MSREIPPSIQAQHLRATRGPVAAALLVASHLAVAAPGAAAQDSLLTAAACEGRIVSSIHVEPEPPRVAGESVPGWIRPVIAMAIQHRTTRPSAIEPFLQLEVGAPCTELRRAESERLLRAQPYLADATVRAVDDGAGGVRVDVETVDEIPLVVGARFDDGRIAGLKYGSGNILGAGMYGSLEWREGFAYRDRLAARYANYHMFDTPARLTVHLDRASLSSNYGLALAHPFLTPYQRTAWHLGYQDASGYVGFERGDQPPLALALERQRLDVGGVFRLGRRAGALFVGPFLTFERIDPGADALVITDTGFTADPDTELDDRFRVLQGRRVGGVLGLRMLTFRTVEGFDALAGRQDVGIGVQIGTAAGRGFGSDVEGMFVAADLYAGAGSERSFLALRAQWEAQEGEGDVRWGDVVSSGRLAWYLKPTPRRTLIASAELAGAWRGRIPYQIHLGRDAGVRGYRDSRIAGARRAVVRAEHRWVIGNLTRFVGLGVAAFGDVGQVWAGEVPFGVNSGTKGSVGAGLLAAIPRQSRRLFRLDLAVPLVRHPYASYEVRLTTSTPVRTFWREPGAIAGIRTVTPPAGIFAWP